MRSSIYKGLWSYGFSGGWMSVNVYALEEKKTVGQK
jgi:hypothetical protein